MEITQEDRLKMLDDIKTNLGFVEREDDEFTIKEIAECFKMDAVNTVAFLDREKIKYERRKALANNRRQYVYRVIIKE